MKRLVVGVVVGSVAFAMAPMLLDVETMPSAAAGEVQQAVPAPYSAEAPDAVAPPEQLEIPATDLSYPMIRSGRTSTSDPREVSLMFGGDVHFENQVRRQQGRGGLKTLGGLFADADLAMVNLETAVTKRGKPIKKEFRFHASPQVLRTLKSRGIDVVSMANNHAFDYGRTGVKETLRAKKAGKMPIVGVGANAAAALAPWVKEVKGTTVAVFGSMNDEPLSDEKNPGALNRSWVASKNRAGMSITPRLERQLLETVKTWSKKVDTVVVYEHWGIETAACPSGKQRSLVAKLRKAGADVIVGSHAHVLQGAGFAGDAAVAYGLGNFVWYNTYSRYSIVAEVVLIDGKPKRMSYIPVEIGSDGQPRRVSGKGANWVKARMSSGARCAGLTATPSS